MGSQSKLSGGGMLPPRESLTNVGAAFLGGFFAIAAVALATQALSVPLVLGSFGATCVLVFGFPKVAFSQPRNVIVGHLMSSSIGLAFLTVLGDSWWSAALALATAIAAMILTRTVHPPAGSNPVIVMFAHPHPAWAFALTPTLYGAVIIVVVAVIFNNIGATRRYPAYWIGRAPERDAKPQPAVPVQGVANQVR